MLLKRQIALALPPQITGFHGANHCRHLGVILRHSKSAFSVLLGLQFQPLQAPHSSIIKVSLLVLVKGAASAISERHSCAHSERHSGTHSSIIQALISAPFKRWSLPLQALVTSAIQALSKRHCRCSIYTLMMCFSPAREGVGLHFDGCSPSQFWRRSHRYRKGCSPSRWPRHAWRCWGWSSPRLKIRKILWY